MIGGSDVNCDQWEQIYENAKVSGNKDMIDLSRQSLDQCRAQSSVSLRSSLLFPVAFIISLTKVSSNLESLAWFKNLLYGIVNLEFYRNDPCLQYLPLLHLEINEQRC